MRLSELEEFGDFLRGPGVSLFDLACLSSAGVLDESPDSTAASTYNCFVAGFCAQAVMDFPRTFMGIPTWILDITQTQSRPWEPAVTSPRVRIFDSSAKTRIKARICAPVSQ